MLRKRSSLKKREFEEGLVVVHCTHVFQIKRLHVITVLDYICEEKERLA